MAKLTESMTMITDQFKDLWEYFIAPALPALLPRFGEVRLRQWLSRKTDLYQEETVAALSAAHSYISIPNEKHWQVLHRLTRLSDIGDVFLSRLRGDRWVTRNVEVHGAWPKGPFLAIAYHYGAGLWGLRHLHLQEPSVAFLAQRYTRATYGKHPLRYFYARLRQREIERVCGAPVIFTGGSVERMQKQLASNGIVVGLIDVPPEMSHNHCPVSFLGKTISLPVGLLKIAANANVPIVPFSVGINMASGNRLLRIGACLDPHETDHTVQQLAHFLEQLLYEDSSGWYFWTKMASLLKVDKKVSTPGKNDP